MPGDEPSPSVSIFLNMSSLEMVACRTRSSALRQDAKTGAGNETNEACAEQRSQAVRPAHSGSGAGTLGAWVWRPSGLLAAGWTEEAVRRGGEHLAREQRSADCAGERLQ